MYERQEFGKVSSCHSVRIVCPLCITIQAKTILYLKILFLIVSFKYKLVQINHFDAYY